MIVVRLLLRFIVVPFGALVALMAASTVGIVAHWNGFANAVAAETASPDGAFMLTAMFGPIFAAIVVTSAVAIVTPASLGALIAEAFAIRSWIFHVANGALAAWIGATLTADVKDMPVAFDRPVLIVAAGVAAGFAYWAVAGWSAGFWKPVFRPPDRSAGAAPGTPAT